ncbi:MAG: methyltransferase domain-containing protein [Candidatus Omnitrophica bacterium]|nr:methyltransferase domain-containing protein [Candidatus Omnitrophota bacterium]
MGFYGAVIYKKFTNKKGVIFPRKSVYGEELREGMTQKEVFEKIYSEERLDHFSFHDSKDPLTRYLRDRRLNIALSEIKKNAKDFNCDWKILTVCDGVGGEGTFFANLGFNSVTVSDISQNALNYCVKRDPRLKTLLLNAEDTELTEATFDLVVVQDGLHHLKRPFLGYTEMLRIARKAVIVIEPHTGVVARIFGTVWEKHYGEVNYVFRWNYFILRQITNSYLLKSDFSIKFIRLWDHNLVMGKIAKIFGGGKAGLFIVKIVYSILNSIFSGFGNMMIGIVIKENSVIKEIINENR